MEKERRMRKEQLVGILEDTQCGIIICNYNPVAQAFEVVYANHGWTDITGYTVAQLKKEKGANPQALLFEGDREDADSQYMRQMRRSGKYELLYRITHRNGEIRWVIDKGVSDTLPDGIIQNKSTITEVTALKEREERMTLLAQTDQLTELYNKATFALLVQAALKRRNKCQHALIMLDIDGFKLVNDNYGHAFGDKVLAAVAARLKNTFRSSDILGRIGGDEFMVLMTDICGEQVALKKTRELCANIRGIKIPGSENICITVSIGIALFPGPKSYKEMFSHVDDALYRAKGNGKDQCVLANAQPAVSEASIYKPRSAEIAATP